MADGYTKLDNNIVSSSIWSEDSDTRVVWITLMTQSDFEGIYKGSMPGLARIANVSLLACQKAIKKFLSEDPYSRSKEHNGRRLEEIEGGWQILNKALYRDKDYSRAGYYRKYRAEKRNSCATDLQQDATHTYKDKDKDKRLKNNIIFNTSSYIFTGIEPDNIEQWKMAYPAVDIDAEILRAALWLRHNPTKRKSNYGRFLTNWFSRTQEKGGEHGTVNNQSQLGQGRRSLSAGNNLASAYGDEVKTCDAGDVPAVQKDEAANPF